jgi:gas vesicle protein
MRETYKLMAKDAEKVLWFLIGAAAGAGIALLYAPSSGEETRRYIRRKTEDARETLAETGEELLEKGRDIYKRGAQVAGEAAELLERGRKAVGV